MQRKIFISINLSDRDKKELGRTVVKWRDLPVKWTKEANLHVTLVYLGHVDDALIGNICKKVKAVASRKSIFDIEFDCVGVGPSASDQRLVWLSGKTSEKMKKLQEEIEKELEIFESEKKSFQPHITLGRIRKHKWEMLDKKPVVKDKFDLILAVETIDVMASNFREGGQEYTIIESCPLK